MPGPRAPVVCALEGLCAAGTRFDPGAAGTPGRRTLRHMIDALQPMRTGTVTVVEMLGDLGSPQHQHDATRSTQRLAALTGAEPVFLKTPGVVSSPQVREALIAHDAYAQQALGFFDRLDLALVGIGGCEADPLQAAGGVFGEDQLRYVLEAGAIGQLCLRFLAADGTPVASPLDDLVTGVRLEQLRAAKRRWAVAGGRSKFAVIRAALLGGWLDTLVTDADTASRLLSTPS